MNDLNNIQIQPVGEHDFVLDRSQPPALIEVTDHGIWLNDPDLDAISALCSACNELHRFSKSEVFSRSRSGEEEMRKLESRFRTNFIGVIGVRIERDPATATLLRELEGIIDGAK